MSPTDPQLVDAREFDGSLNGIQVIGNFVVLHPEVFPDNKTARSREKFLESGQGHKWLDSIDYSSEPAKPPAGVAHL